MSRLCILLSLLVSSVYLTSANKTKPSNDDKEVCMRDIGCFGITEDFKGRTINFLPKDRRIINTQFFLYTRNNPQQRYILIANKPKTLIYSPLDTTLPTKIIVHGFLDNEVFAKWQVEMKDELMKHDEYNVIIVDWSGGNQLPYTQATANTRVVGAEIAFLIKQLQKYLNFNIKTCHIIGHSLGAHIAGYAGERLNKLSRITALDPAAPYFQGMPPSVRIDPTDAEFVDAIHTDSESILGIVALGMRQPVGHVDFFPNDGKKQPGCETSKRLWNIFEETLINGVRNFLSCSHQRAVDFFKSSINIKGCQYIGHICSNWTKFVNGNCIDCGPDKSDCAIMGLHADQFKVSDPNSSVEAFLITQDGSPYCAHQYRVAVHLSQKNEENLKGKIRVIIRDEAGNKVTVSLHEKYSELSPGSTFSSVFVMPSKLSSKKPIDFYWQTDNLFSSYKINVEAAEIVPMNYEEARILMHQRTVYRQETISPIKESTTVKMYPDIKSV